MYGMLKSVVLCIIILSETCTISLDQQTDTLLVLKEIKVSSGLNTHTFTHSMCSTEWLVVGLKRLLKSFE